MSHLLLPFSISWWMCYNLSSPLLNTTPRETLSIARLSLYLVMLSSIETDRGWVSPHHSSSYVGLASTGVSPSLVWRHTHRVLVCNRRMRVCILFFTLFSPSYAWSSPSRLIYDSSPSLLPTRPIQATNTHLQLEDYSEFVRGIRVSFVYPSSSLSQAYHEEGDTPLV